MTVYVFTGPSLPPNDAAAAGLEAVFLPPVAQGDIIRLLAAEPPPTMIGIIDGYFERVPAIWHKEILYAMSRGVPVFGSASMGALRAAELEAFGMVGVGAVFVSYRDGVLEDDDEVAVHHGPPELGYPMLSEAMVNIRRTLGDAAAAGVIGEVARALVERQAKMLPYGRRSWSAALTAARAAAPQAGDELDALERWLPTGRVDQKRQDALLMLRTMREHREKGLGPPPIGYHFETTTFWQRALEWAEADRREQRIG